MNGTCLICGICILIVGALIKYIPKDILKEKL